MQISLACSTHRDGRVLQWLKKHELAIRSEILVVLADTPEEDAFVPEGKQRLQKRLTGAINKVLDRAGWSLDQVDLFEVNEAFACVAMFAMHDLGIPHDKINVHGGATALGHPIGASGARIVTTLIAALKRHGKTRGVASLCIGGGEATAIAIELIA